MIIAMCVLILSITIFIVFVDYKKGRRKEMRLAVLLKDSRQYTEDNFEAITHVKEITEKTTIQELIEWQSEKMPHDKGYFRQMYITQMD
jgi:hypothetical protein